METPPLVKRAVSPAWLRSGPCNAHSRFDQKHPARAAASSPSQRYRERGWRFIQKSAAKRCLMLRHIALVSRTRHVALSEAAHVAAALQKHIRSEERRVG